MKFISICRKTIMRGTLPPIQHLTVVMIHSITLASTIKMGLFFCYSDFTFLLFCGGGGKREVAFILSVFIPI
jgi:hypothetical protein